MKLNILRGRSLTKVSEQLLVFSSLLVITFCSFSVSGQKDPLSYSIFDAKGKKSDWKSLVNDSKKSQVIFFGELHNNAIAHWLQIELLTELHGIKDIQLSLGLEMFETDVQHIIDEFLGSKISTKNFESESRIWSNFETDYKPLIEYCKTFNIPVFASNIPRRYASMIYHQGDSSILKLNSSQRELIPDWPISFDPTLTQYQKMSDMSGGHGGENMIKAQAWKDATMAKEISESLNQSRTVLHLNGSFHSDFNQGIIWYLQKLHPNVVITTISQVEQNSLEKLELEHLGKADYIICVNDKVTKTH